MTISLFYRSRFHFVQLEHCNTEISTLHKSCSYILWFLYHVKFDDNNGAGHRDEPQESRRRNLIKTNVYCFVILVLVVKKD